MKGLIRRGLGALGLEIRRVRPHHGVPNVEEIGLPQVLEMMFRCADDLTFVQIGANDGVCNDLLVSCLAKSNPKGILVEPQAEPFRKLQERYGDRERFALLRGAIDQQAGTRTLYRCRDDLAEGDGAAFLSGLASFNRSHVVQSYRRHARRLGLHCPPDRAIIAEDVPTFTLESVLRQHRIDRCDLVMLDTEGYDFEIIKTLDFSRTRPAVLIYEHRHLCRADRLACWRLLHTNGYRCAAGWSDTLAILAADATCPTGAAYPACIAAA